MTLYEVKVVWSDASADATVSLTLHEDGEVQAMYVDCGPEMLRLSLEDAARALRGYLLPRLF